MTSKGSRVFGYDNQGNRTSDGSKTLTFDFDNKLKTFTDPNGATANYVYDAAGNRIEKNITGGASRHFVNDLSGDLSKVLVNKNVTASTNAYYVYAGGLLSQGDTSANSRRYYLDDGLGNIRYTTNNTGGNVQSYAYDPYGNTITGGSHDFGFQEQQKDAESSLTYLRARYYDPTTGGFISRDPIEGSLRKPLTQNNYPYAGNNPVNFSDPSGLWYINIGGGVGAFIFNINGGIVIGDKGLDGYVGTGVSVRPGVGGSATYSSGESSAGWSGNLSAFLGVGGSISNDGTIEVGIGTPSAGANVNYTWSIHKNYSGGACR